MFHILVVEDDSKLRHLFCTVLRKLGYTCTEAENGQAAIRDFVPELMIIW